MKLAQYLEKRRQLSEPTRSARPMCLRCHQPTIHCYCAQLAPFDPQITFAILIHPLEARRRIASGRMAHLSLCRSELIDGGDYSQNPRVNALITAPEHTAVVLYPGPGATDLSRLTLSERATLFPTERRLVVFVIDGTWATARTTMRKSANLRALPRIAFSPTQLSCFQVRRQPAPECHSTIEAIHQTIELLGPSRGFALESRAHDRMLDVFHAMVARQLAYTTRHELREAKRLDSRYTQSTKSETPNV